MIKKLFVTALAIQFLFPVFLPSRGMAGEATDYSQFPQAESNDTKNKSNTPAVPTTSASNAYDVSGTDNNVQKVGSLVGVGMGVAIAKTSCGTPNTLLCIIGIGGALQSVATLNMADGNTNPSSWALGTGTSPMCVGENCAGSSTTGNPYSGENLAGTPFSGDYDTLKKLAADKGVDLNNPNSVKSFLDSHSADLAAIDGGGSGGTSGLSLSSQEKAMIEKAKAAAQAKASKYTVSSVALDSGGGGRRSGSSTDPAGGKEGFNIEDLLNGLNKNKTTIGGQSSAHGLQRNLASGEPVGVSSDSIFKLISRRYQNKIQIKSFLK
jgi:hypothetical protein